MTDDQLRSFALGYYHGRADGVDRNPYYEKFPYTDANELLTHLYRRGYDAGVADYAEGESK